MHLGLRCLIALERVAKSLACLMRPTEKAKVRGSFKLCYVTQVAEEMCFWAMIISGFAERLQCVHCKCNDAKYKATLDMSPRVTSSAL